MNRTTLTAIVLLIPAALFADVKVNVSASINTSADIVYVDEPWFEEIECNDDSRVSFEYQWTDNHGARMLNYRQVTFVPFTGAWVFGPWMIKHEIYAARHHVNHNNNWVREFSHYDRYHKPQYRYSYREQAYTHNPSVHARSYKYSNYGTQHNYNNRTNVTIEKQVNVKPRYQKQSGNEFSHNETRMNYRTNDNKSKNNNNHGTLVRVTERETIRR